MRKLYLRALALPALTIVFVTGAALPASATGFAKSEYQVGESNGYVELSVQSFSFCCPAESGQFDYYTANLSAVAGEDYQQTSGTMTTAWCGPTPCTIRVPIINDDLFEGEEQFEVRLTNFKGTFSPSSEGGTAVVRILDDETPPSSSSATASSSGSSSSRSSRSGADLTGPVQQGAAQPKEVFTADSPKEPSSSEIVTPSQEAETPTAEGIPAAAGGRRETESPFPAALAAAAYAVVAGAALWLLWRRRFFRSLGERR